MGEQRSDRRSAPNLARGSSPQITADERRWLRLWVASHEAASTPDVIEMLVRVGFIRPAGLYATAPCRPRFELTDRGLQALDAA